MPSGDPLITAPIDERQTLVNELTSLVVATEHATWKPVPLGDLDGASVVIIKAVGGPILVRMSYVNDSGSVVFFDVPVDQFLALTTASQRITSIYVMPDVGASSSVTVKFFLGQQAG